MLINNIGYNHCHDTDFVIERPYGSGDYLLMLMKSDAIFTIDGKDVFVPENSFFIFKKDRPQVYRCIPQHTFANDWIHFMFEDGEEEEFLSRGLNYETPVQLDNPCFISFCIKSMASEMYSEHVCRLSNINHYAALMFNHASECLHEKTQLGHNNYYELLSAVRNRIYSGNYHFFCVESSAHEIRMSKSNFQHLYKKYFGVTFIQDLINSRIEHAKMLLLNTNLTSTSIAEQCGYKNYAHFARQFKEITAMTPITFRNRHSPSTADSSEKH